MRRAAVAVLAALLLAGCISSAYSCKNRTCKVTFGGTGAQDLSEPLGVPAEIELVSIEPERVRLEVAGDEVTLERGVPTPVGPLSMVLRSVQDDDVELQVVGPNASG